MVHVIYRSKYKQIMIYCVLHVLSMLLNFFLGTKFHGTQKEKSVTRSIWQYTTCTCNIPFGVKLSCQASCFCSRDDYQRLPSHVENIYFLCREEFFKGSIIFYH